MSSPDTGRFTPESASSTPLDSSQVTGRGSSRLSWRSGLLSGGAMVAMMSIGGLLGVTISTSVLSGIPLEHVLTSPLPQQYVREISLATFLVLLGGCLLDWKVCQDLPDASISVSNLLRSQFLNFF